MKSVRREEAPAGPSGLSGPADSATADEVRSSGGCAGRAARAGAAQQQPIKAVRRGEAPLLVEGRRRGEAPSGRSGPAGAAAADAVRSSGEAPVGPPGPAESSSSRLSLFVGGRRLRAVEAGQVQGTCSARGDRDAPDAAHAVCRLAFVSSHHIAVCSFAVCRLAFLSSHRIAVCSFAVCRLAFLSSHRIAVCRLIVCRLTICRLAGCLEMTLAHCIDRDAPDAAHACLARLVTRFRSGPPAVAAGHGPACVDRAECCIRLYRLAHPAAGRGRRWLHVA